MFGQPAGGGMYGQPMGGGMYGQPASGGMYGQPAGPYGGMQGGAGMAPAGGMAPGGMFGGTPQSKSWLMNRTTGPAFAPPPPAEAAANWANHAAIANSKAEGALSEILAIKQAAISKMKELDIKADRIQQDFNSMRESTISDLRKEAATVWHNYQEAKQSTMQMLKAAETQAIAAKKLVTGASDAVRVKSASFAQRAVDTSFAKKVPVSAAPKGGAKDTKSDPEVDAVLQSIRNYMAKLKAGEVKVAVKTVDPLAKAADSAKAESAEQSAAQMKAAEAERKAAAADVIKNTPADADSAKYLARLSAATIIHDGAIAVDNALKLAKDSADALVLKDIEAERKILDLMREAQTLNMQAAEEVSKAEATVRKAIDFTNDMAHKAAYAQNAAGQAMAAQMAQAMGFPVAPQGVPSLFAPPAVAEACIPSAVLALTLPRENRNAFLSSCF